MTELATQGAEFGDSNNTLWLKIATALQGGGSLVATTLIFSTQPGGAVAGEPFTQQPVVTVRDQNGATLTTYSGDVTIAKQSGSGTLSGDTTVAAVAGVATFVDLELSAADDYVLRASIASPALTVDSASFFNDIPGTWSARLQTHNGDNVPLGLYQDVACTIPATEDFDPVAAIRGEFATGTVTAVQADEAKQGYLLHINGTPTVQLDGVDDRYTTTVASSTSSWTLIAVYAPAVSSVFDPANRRVLATDENSLIGPFGGKYTLYDGDFASSAGGFTDEYVVQIGAHASGSGRNYVDGVAAGTSTGTQDLGTAISIGSHQNGSSEFFNGGLVAILILNSALSVGNVAVVNSYLTGLIP